jgi:hypothetical protein
MCLTYVGLLLLLLLLVAHHALQVVWGFRQSDMCLTYMSLLLLLFAVHVMQEEMYEALQAQQQPGDASLRRPSHAAKAVAKLSAKRSKDGAAAAEEGTKLAAKLKRSRKPAGAAAKPKKQKTVKQKTVEESEDDSDWDSDQGEGSSQDAAGEDGVEAAEGSSEEEPEMQGEQQAGVSPAPTTRADRRRAVVRPARFRE